MFLSFFFLFFFSLSVCMCWQWCQVSSRTRVIRLDFGTKNHLTFMIKLLNAQTHSMSQPERVNDPP